MKDIKKSDLNRRMGTKLHVRTIDLNSFRAIQFPQNSSTIDNYFSFLVYSIHRVEISIVYPPNPLFSINFIRGGYDNFLFIFVAVDKQLDLNKINQFFILQFNPTSCLIPKVLVNIRQRSLIVTGKQFFLICSFVRMS